MEHHRLLSPDRLVVWAFFILYAAEAEREQAAAVCWGWHFTFPDALSTALAHVRSPAGLRR